MGDFTPLARYTISISFDTDSILTPEEIDALLFGVAVQVEEPSGLDGSKRAEYRTQDVTIDITR